MSASAATRSSLPNYNAPNVEQLRKHYEDLPERLAAEQIGASIPWLYGYELDFRFR